MTIPTDEHARNEWIKYQLGLRKLSLRKLGRTLAPRNNKAEQMRLAGLPTTALHRRYPRMETLIAKALGLRPEQIWPDRYDSSGKPIRRKPGPKSGNHACRNSRKAPSDKNNSQQRVTRTGGKQ